jgi:hypothetical protein
MLNGPDNPFHEDIMGPLVTHVPLLGAWPGGARTWSKPRESRDKVVREVQVLDGPDGAGRRPARTVGRRALLSGGTVAMMRAPLAASATSFRPCPFG